MFPIDTVKIELNMKMATAESANPIPLNTPTKILSDLDEGPP